MKRLLKEGQTVFVECTVYWDQKKGDKCVQISTDEFKNIPFVLIDMPKERVFTEQELRERFNE